MRRAQAIVETLVAVLVILFLFTGAHRISRMVAAKTVLDHAAARAARAKAVGFNDFMCEKTALAAAIPVSGRRLWPLDSSVDEVSRVPIYLASGDRGRANGVLEYERWHSASVSAEAGSGADPVASAKIEMEGEDFSLNGSAKIEAHHPFYMFDQGL